MKWIVRKNFNYGQLEFQLDPQNIYTLLDKVGPIVDNVDVNCLE